MPSRLVVVMGNPAVLAHDERWCWLLQFIYSNGGCTSSAMPSIITQHGSTAATPVEEIIEIGLGSAPPPDSALSYDAGGLNDTLEALTLEKPMPYSITASAMQMEGGEMRRLD